MLHIAQQYRAQPCQQQLRQRSHQHGQQSEVYESSQVVTRNSLIKTGKLIFFFKKRYGRIETCNASLADRLAALETRTFARTETHIPTYPAMPEHRAPKRKEATVI